MLLVVAEKPSVGMALAKALGVTDKKDGYIESNEYIRWEMTPASIGVG